MPWVTLTVDHVKSRVSDDEIEVYEQISNSEEGETKLGSIIFQVASMIRGACLSNARLTFLGPAGTIPEFCIYHASAMARNALLGVPPVADGFTNPRRDEQKAAEDFVKSLKDMHPAAFEQEPVAATDSAASYGGDPLIQF